MLRIIRILAVGALVFGTGGRAEAAHAAGGTSVEIREIEMKCGGLYGAYVSVDNAGTTPFTGHVDFEVGADLKTEPFEIAPQSKRLLVVMHSKPFNCHAPLAKPRVDVYRNDTKVDAKTLIPRGFKGERALDPPVTEGPGTAPPVWIRRLALEGFCGEAGVGSADLFLLGAGAKQKTQIALDYGGAATGLQTVTVKPNVVTAVQVMIPESSPTDCQGPSGLPILRYQFPGSPVTTPATGTLEPLTVRFVPT